MYTRRDIGKLALGGMALTASAASGDSGIGAAGGVRLGATTWSLRDLPRIPGKDNIDDLIKPLKSAGVTEIDLWSYSTEPAGPNTGPGAPPPPAAYPIRIHTFSKEEIAAAMLQARNMLRDFRLNTPANYYENIRAKFDAAGIAVSAYTVKYDETFTDEEIDVTFGHARVLGASSITAPGASEIMKRLAPFAEKHRMNVALSDFTLATSLPSTRFSSMHFSSMHFKVNADVGAITAANGSPVAWILENYDAISQITVKDRRRNKGQNEQFGDGDTPIQDVLRLVKQKKYTFPVFAEYEYLGLGTPAEELQHCMDYMRSALS
jgi:sugar phosphate isomerase/epimerase